jgi:tetratricopeptide (TPR) repeat protein
MIGNESIAREWIRFEPNHRVAVRNPGYWLKLLAVLISLSYLFIVTAPVVAFQANTIRGKVRSQDGTVINNAIVELRIGGGAMISQTVTRNDGDFAFTGLTAGEYEVNVTVAGFDHAAQMVRFTDSGRMNFAEVQQVEILMRPRMDNNQLLGLPGVSFVQDVPKAARTSYDKAIAKFRETKPEEGVALLKEAIAAFDDYFDARFALARELFREGKDNEALEQLERTRQINDRQDAVFHLFGRVMMKQQKFVVAEYAFGQAAKLNPTNAGAHFYRGLALIEVAIRGADEKQRGAELAEAEKELNRAFEISDQRMTAVYYQRARIYEKRGDYLAAAKELENFLKAEPDAKNAATIRALITKLRSEKK